MSLPTDTAGPFDVNTNDLIQIDAGQAVDLFRQLLVIEAAKVGIPITGVDVPAAINVADGGIDAKVVGVSGKNLPAGLISEGLTCYQIKTGSFSASKPSDIKSLLVQPKFVAGDRQRTKEDLQPRVLSCFEKRGTFVVVLFGSDLVGTEDDHGEIQIRKFMESIDPEFAEVCVRIIRANQLCAAIKMLAPGIALRLNRVQGYDKDNFQDMSFMAESCDLEVDGYHLTNELKNAAAQITRAADNISGFQHVRVLGDAGAGKTHLMYHALSASQLRGCVLYCRDPEQALDSGQLSVLRRMSSQTTIILIADECDLETAEDLVSRFKRVATKMLLVTADNLAEPTSAHANTQIIDVPRLEQLVVADIFKSYGILENDANWFATLCEGSPRAAHRLGQYIRNNPDQQPAQQLAHLDWLWERVVCAPHNIDSADGRDRLAVIRTMALFQNIGWDTADGPEVQAEVLAALKLLDENFTRLKLAHSVDELRRRRVLQGPRMLMISPKLLHVAMWKNWFEIYSKAVDILQLRKGLSPRMQQSFDAMLIFVRESRAATAWADRLMGEGAMFASLTGFESSSDASLFFAIAQAKPKAALRRFAIVLGRETVENRQKFTGNARRTAVHRLEQFAVPAETFFEAAECLLLLAEAENESWSNNATGIFISLFSLGHGPLSASELSPIEKLDFLRKHLHSENPFRRSIVIQALSKSLDPFMSRDVIEETVGLRRLPSRWMPETYEQLYEVYAAHVRLLEEAVDHLPTAEANEAAKGILTYFRILVQIIPITKMVVAFIRRASAMPALREQCIETIVATLHYEGKELPENVVSELDAIRIELTESSFSNKLRRHAGMKLLEDHFDTAGDVSEVARPELIELVTASLADPRVLIPELAWLVTDKAKNGFQFGQILGQADNLKLWDLIVSSWIQAGKQRSDFFIGGYLSALHAKNVDLWGQHIEELLKNNDIRDSVLSLVWRSGMSDRIATVLLELAKKREIDPIGLRLFALGGVVNQLPLCVFEDIVDLLLEIDETNAPEAAMDILSARLHARSEEMSILSSCIERALNSDVFVVGVAVNENVRSHSNNMLLYRWNNVANRLLAFNSNAGSELAVRCIANFGNINSITDGYRPESLKFLANAAQARPDVIWAAIAKRLEAQPNESGTRKLLSWLRGGLSIDQEARAGIDCVPSPLIFEWIDVAPSERARLMAAYCQPNISMPGNPPTFARQMLERYGEMEPVRRGLHANNLSGVWAGPSSEHFRRKLEALEAHIDIETNDNVRMWLKEHRGHLEYAISREVERELLENEQ